jgi:hypothetical protein
MDDKRFWDLIAVACKHDVEEDFTDEWSLPLVEQLMTLPPQDVVRFDRWFDEKTDALYTRDHWGAAYFINGGASDDGFYYFRCWLVGMGKTIYEAALKDPDTLADVVVNADRLDYEAEIYGAASIAWENLGRSEEEFDEVDEALGKRRPGRELTGKKWNFGSQAERRRRFPRLVALFGGTEDD